MTQTWIAALAVAFVAGMIWLRTRMSGRRGIRGPLVLTRAGAAYFAAAGLLLASGWLVAPPLARLWLPASPGAATVGRVIWALGVYYLCIVVHQVVRSRAIALFAPDPPR